MLQMNCEIFRRIWTPIIYVYHTFSPPTADQKIIMNYLTREEILVVNNKYSVSVEKLSVSELPLGGLMFLKLAYLPLNHCFSGKCEANAKKISAEGFLTETVCCLTTMDYYEPFNQDINYSQYCIAHPY